MAWSTYCDESVLADANALDPQAAALSIIIHVLNLCAIYPEVHNLLFAENTKNGAHLYGQCYRFTLSAS